MSSELIDKEGGDASKRAASVQPAPGGTLLEYGEWLKASSGVPVVPDQDRTLWVRGSPRELQRLPLEYTAEVTEATRIRWLLGQPGTWLISYQLTPSPEVVANCFDYVCRNPAYDIEGLPKNARRDIRRGLRSFTVRLCSWDELAEKGYCSLADTEARHGYSPPARDSVRRLADRLRGSRWHELWGAWKDGQLAAWTIVLKADDWAGIVAARSCTATMSGCPNNAIVYEATRLALVHEKRRYVTYGLSSAQTGINELSMHRFKTRMGFDALPMHRKFVLHPLLRSLIEPRVSAWLVGRLSRLWPHSVQLRKLAGMTHLISSRDRDPLAWVEESSGVAPEDEA